MASSKKDPDGLFRRGGIYYCWIRGKRVSTRCRSRKAARAVRDRLERAAVDPVYRASVKATVGECSAMTLAAIERRGRAAETLTYYRSKLGQLVRVLGEGIRLEQLSPELVEQYIDQRRSEDASQHTISKELGALRHMLRVAKHRGAYGGDIDALFPVGFATGYNPRRRSLSVDEIRCLLAELPPHRQAWVAFAIATGARESEIARAQPVDISPRLDVVQIRGTKTDLADDAVAVPAAFRWLLELAIVAGSEPGPLTGSPLLVGPWPNSMRDLKAAARRAGIDPVSANDLRRTHATLLRASGASVDIVARQLRHADSRMVQRVYGRLTAAQVVPLLPGPTTVQIQLRGYCEPGRCTEKCGVSDGNRTRDNWSHKPLSGAAEAVNPSESEGVRGAGGASADLAPSRISPATAREFRALSWIWLARRAA